MLYTVQIPSDPKNIIFQLTPARHDCGHGYHPLIKVNISRYSYVLIGFASGRIDNHVVFVHLHIGHQWPYFMPLMYDYQLLGHLQKVGRKYRNTERIWLDFIKVYLHTNKHARPRNDWVFDHIADINHDFDPSCLIWVYFLVIHLAMISELFYTRPTRYGLKPSYLGKKVKFIGCFQTLRLQWSPKEAAEFSRHKPSTYIEKCFELYWHQDQRDSKVKDVTNGYFRQILL